MGTENTMISVCMATFNGEKYIREQLDSILCQLSNSDEVIVSDDSSTDTTLTIIEKINDNRIKVLPNNHFRSPVFNLENALKHAKGDFIFLSDQDDIWMPNRVKFMLKTLEKIDLCVCDCELVDANGKILHPSFFQLNHSKKGFLRNIVKNSYLGCCMAFKRSILTYVLPFPVNIAMHDIWIGLCVELWGQTAFIEDKLTKYRRHGKNLTTTGGRSNFSIVFKIHYRLILFFQLFKRKLQCICNNSLFENTRNY